MSTPLYGREQVCQALTRHVDAWRNGKGGLVMVAAEPGRGKSATLTWLEETYRDSATVIRVDCHPPIGTLNTTAIRPLQPFGLAIDRLYVQSSQQARKRLALNVGMSLLSSLPIAGDLFYAAKAISQDVREYKRETAVLQEKKANAVQECASTLRAIAEKTPFILLVDDGHWSDPQSVEVLSTLVQELDQIPLLIVWTVEREISQQSNLPLETLMRNDVVRGAMQDLPAVSRDAVASIMHDALPSASIPDAIIDAVVQRSGGNPGIVVEYTRFLEAAGHVASDGTIDASVFDSIKLRASDHPTTDMLVSDISEDDAIVLSLCAAEGREFTAFLQAALNNTDVLSMIRTLRRIERTTGVIRSVGMRTRFGVKTTTYEFTDAFPYTFFVHRPEYEERKDIHQRIAQILQREYTATPHEELRAQLAVDIAAHSVEAEDTQMVERMLGVVAEHAGSSGTPELASYINTTMMPTLRGAVDIDDDGASATSESSAGTAVGEGTAQTFDHVVRTCTNALIQGRSAQARTTAVEALESMMGMSRHERIVLSCLIARADIDMGRLDDAQAVLNTVSSLPDVQLVDVCLIRNVEGILSHARGDHGTALQQLRDAARLAENLPAQSRIMTLGNIVLHMRSQNDPSVGRYETLLRNLITAHGLPGLRADLEL